MKPNSKKLLFLDSKDPSSLLLIPEAGPVGTLALLSDRARNPSQSLDLPFLAFEQDALLYVIETALAEPHRGRGKTAQAAKPSKNKLIESLSPYHYLTKAWLQYFRAIVLKLSTKEIASTLELNPATWRRWEAPNPYLPPPYWADLLWRWWERCYLCIDKDHRALAEPERLPQWLDVTTEDERVGLIKSARPRYFYQLDLKRRQQIEGDE